MLYSKFIYRNCDVSKFWRGLSKESPMQSKHAFEDIIPFQKTYLREAGFPSIMNIKQNGDLD